VAFVKNLPKVNRVEVIDSEGRAFVRYYVEPGAALELQDDGRTLKIFVQGPTL
jgi:hypothetical protein